MLNVESLRFPTYCVSMEPLQIEQFKEGLYGLRRGFSNRKQNVGNHWKHWVLGNLVDFVNTKYRKHHRLSSDEFIVIHQSEPIERRRLS